jgi:hypothetical protein
MIGIRAGPVRSSLNGGAAAELRRLLECTDSLIVEDQRIAIGTGGRCD